MNWRFIFFLSPIGILLGILSAWGIKAPWILIPTIFFCLLAAYMLVRYDLKKWFPTAIAIGMLWGILQQSFQALYFETPMEHSAIFEGISTRHWNLLTGVLTGLATGILIAIFTWILKKVVPVKTF
ncbi:MAG: hypothetical protein KTR22_10280 [Flavobacteriaceae bacterium]|nr:hypothetical protein [Flavobacteriaceae bacterium]